MEHPNKMQNDPKRPQHTPGRENDPKHGGQPGKENDPNRQPGREHKPEQPGREERK